MKIAWILWWIATIFWGVVAIGLLVFTLMNGLNSGIEWYKFTFVMIGIFCANHLPSSVVNYQSHCE